MRGVGNVTLAAARLHGRAAAAVASGARYMGAGRASSREASWEKALSREPSADISRTGSSEVFSRAGSGEEIARVASSELSSSYARRESDGGRQSGKSARFRVKTAD